MTEIKSALELALARTENIEGGKETLKANDLRKDGKKLASAYLDPDGKTDEKQLLAKIKSLADNEKRWFKEGVFDVLVANLNLPANDSFTEKLQALEKALQTLLKERKQISYVFQQISQFFTQYLQSREQMAAALKKQCEPQLREKERLLEQQLGTKVRLTPEQDKEFMALLAKNYSQLDAQHNQALHQVKDQLKQMFGR